MYKLSKLLEDHEYNSKKLYADKEKVIYDGKVEEGKTIKDIIPNIKEADTEKYEIEEGQIKYVGDNKKEEEIIEGIIEQANLKIEIKVEKIEYTKATIGIELKGKYLEQNKIEKLIIKHKKKGETKYEEKEITEKIGAKITEEISGLEMGGTYEIKVEGKVGERTYEKKIEEIKILTDRTAPTVPTGLEKREELNSIWVKGIGSKDEETGIRGYQYSINGTNWSEIIEEGKEYEIRGIKAGTRITIYAKAINNVYMESEKYEISGNTIGITDNVSISKSTSNWTAEDITITLSYPNIPTGYAIQYKVGTGSWTTGTSVVVTSNNTTVYGRLYNTSLDDEIATNSVTITNIDKVNPDSPTGITKTEGLNSITVKATGGSDSLSGVAGYQYSINNSTWTTTKLVTESYTFEGIKANTNVTVYARTIDKVGRRSTVYSTAGGTIGVTDNVTLSKSTSSWVNGDVTVSLTYPSVPAGYAIQYKVGTSSWTAGSSVVVTSNNTTVYGRLYNTSLDDEIAVNTVTITNIDKVNPGSPTGIEKTEGLNSITVKATGGSDSLSGIAGYQYSINNTNWTGTIASGTTHTFNNIKANTNVTVYARTIDKVGRISTVYSTAGGTIGVT